MPASQRTHRSALAGSMRGMQARLFRQMLGLSLALANAPTTHSFPSYRAGPAPGILTRSVPEGGSGSPSLSRRIPRLRVLMLRGFLAPTGAMVNSRGLPAPGPRAHSGPRGWEPLAIFRAPLGQSTNSATSKLAQLRRRQASILTRTSTPRSEKRPQPGMETSTLLNNYFIATITISFTRRPASTRACPPGPIRSILPGPEPCLIGRCFPPTRSRWPQ